MTRDDLRFTTWPDHKIASLFEAHRLSMQIFMGPNLHRTICSACKRSSVADYELLKIGVSIRSEMGLFKRHVDYTRYYESLVRCKYYKSGMLRCKWRLYPQSMQMPA